LVSLIGGAGYLVFGKSTTPVVKKTKVVANVIPEPVNKVADGTADLDWIPDHLKPQKSKKKTQ
jgi:hypothetical protein